MRSVLVVLLLISLSVSVEASEIENPWNPLEFLVGSWGGIGEGKWGSSKVEREYQFILDGAFLEGRNKSTYEPQEKNPKGEVHENLDIFSYDTKRKTFVMRQFHAEGIFNEYALDSLASDGKYFEFVGRNIENFADGWRAKECYEILGDDEFIETFYLAGPGKQFQAYAKNHFTRNR